MYLKLNINNYFLYFPSSVDLNSAGDCQLTTLTAVFASSDLLDDRDWDIYSLTNGNADCFSTSSSSGALLPSRPAVEAATAESGT